MKVNKYDDPKFFSAYANLTRSVDGLDGAGEWPILKALIPNVKNQ